MANHFSSWCLCDALGAPRVTLSMAKDPSKIDLFLAPLKIDRAGSHSHPLASQGPPKCPKSAAAFGCMACSDDKSSTKLILNYYAPSIILPPPGQKGTRVSWGLSVQPRAVRVQPRAVPFLRVPKTIPKLIPQFIQNESLREAKNLQKCGKVLQNILF